MKFEDGTLVKGAYVIIDGVEHEVHMPEYSGNTPLTPENLNKAHDDILKELAGEEVYTNTNGINTSFNLTTNLRNAKYIDVYYVGKNSLIGDDIECIKRLPLVNGAVNSTIEALYAGAANLWIMRANINITGTRVSIANNIVNVLGSEVSVRQEASIYITRIIAYSKESQTEEISEGLTEEERVIELVKQEYGTDQGVSFNIVNKTGQIYNVSVVDDSSSAVLKWYTVDMSTETVTED